MTIHPLYGLRHSLHDARTPVVMAHAGASWRTNQPAPAPARQAAAAPDLVEKVTAAAHHRVMTDMESRYSRENGRLPSRLLPCEFFDNSITAMVRQLLAAKGKNQLSRTKDIELHFFYNPATYTVPQTELQFMVIFDKGPGMNKEEITGWAEMAHKTSDRMDSKIIRDADKVGHRGLQPSTRLADPRIEQPRLACLLLTCVSLALDSSRRTTRRTMSMAFPQHPSRHPRHLPLPTATHCHPLRLPPPPTAYT